MAKTVADAIGNKGQDDDQVNHGKPLSLSRHFLISGVKGISYLFIKGEGLLDKV
jgi:hypothetical protein